MPSYSEEAVIVGGRSLDVLLVHEQREDEYAALLRW
jgi:hypothetical protein